MLGNAHSLSPSAVKIPNPLPLRTRCPERKAEEQLSLVSNAEAKLQNPYIDTATDHAVIRSAIGFSTDDLRHAVRTQLNRGIRFHADRSRQGQNEQDNNQWQEYLLHNYPLGLSD